MSSSERVAAFYADSEARRLRALGPKTRSLAVEDGCLILTLTGGAVEGTTLSVPVAAIPRISQMSEEQLRDVKFMSGGLVLWWPAKNVDIFTDTLIEIATGARSARAHARQNRRRARKRQKRRQTAQIGCGEN